MSLMLPAEPAHARSLTAVVPGLFDSIQGRAGWLPAARSVVLLLVDGLGAQNLRARSGHARFLSAAGGAKDVARSVFPTTTAVALTSLMTGVDAGEHGIVGYRTRVPDGGHVANNLSGWEQDGLDPATWQRAQTYFERHPETPGIVVSKPEYAASGFTRASFRGLRFEGVASLADRLRVAAEQAASTDGALVYVYVPELDALGHRNGWESDAWTSRLEDVDDAVRRAESTLPPDVGMLVTADHGMVDVPARAHVLLGDGDPLTAEVDAIAGEPRMLHLYAAPGAHERVYERWATSEGGRAWVLRREDAVEAGLFGARVDDEVRARIGDVVVAARAQIAYYDDRLEDTSAQRMVGQHGSLTSAERIVPLIRLGAYRR